MRRTHGVSAAHARNAAHVGASDWPSPRSRQAAPLSRGDEHVTNCRTSIVVEIGCPLVTAI
jgi:hypothetical protein